jgi:hypothetical protein
MLSKRCVELPFKVRILIEDCKRYFCLGSEVAAAEKTPMHAEI